MSAPEGPEVPKLGQDGEEEDSEAVSPEEALEMLPTEEELESELDG